MRGASALALSIGTTLVCSAALVGVLVVGRPVPQSVAPAVEPVYAVIEQQPSDENQPATLQVSMTGAASVLSPGGEGVVTEVGAPVGAAIADGSLVYRVSNNPVFAYESPVPLFRTLKAGDKGPDVVALQEFLARSLGQAFVADGIFGPSTVKLWATWSVGAGLAKATPVDPSRFVRIDGPMTVQTSSLQVGAPLPALGQPVLVGSPEVASIQLDPARPVPDGAYVFISSGGRLDVTLTGEAWSVDPASADALLAALAQATTANLGAGTAAPAAAPVAGGGESAPAQAGARLEGRLALATPRESYVVPPSALVGSGDGVGACIWLRGDRGVTGVQVLGATVSGAVMIEGEDLAGEAALLDPSRFVVDAGCP